MSRNSSLMASAISRRSSGPIRICSERPPLLGAVPTAPPGTGAAATGAGACAGAATGAGAGVGAGAGAAAAGTALRPSASVSMRATRSVVDRASPSLPAWWRASRLRLASADSSNTSTISGIGVISCRRSRSSSDSMRCVSSVTSAKPKVAAPPLIECAHRKMPLSSSSLAADRSRFSSICSIWSRFSAASSKKI